MKRRVLTLIDSANFEVPPPDPIADGIGVFEVAKQSYTHDPKRQRSREFRFEQGWRMALRVSSISRPAPAENDGVVMLVDSVAHKSSAPIKVGEAGMIKPMAVLLNGDASRLYMSTGHGHKVFAIEPINWPLPAGLASGRGASPCPLTVRCCLAPGSVERRFGGRRCYEHRREEGEGWIRAWGNDYARAVHTFMTDRPRSLVLPFLGRLGQGERDSSHFTELEAEIVGLFDQMRARILRYALSFGLPIADGEEILQEAFLALYQHLLRGRSRDGLPGWLFRVTHNLSLKRRLVITRAAASSLTEETERESTLIADPQPSPEDQFAFRQRQNHLRSVVDALPEMDRECLYLRAEGFRYREIAEVLGISLGSVANSLVRSLARLSAANERLG